MNEQAIFAAALQHDPKQRAAFLDETCGADLALRQRVEVLLAAHENAGSFMQQPAAGGFTEAYRPISEGPGSVIGTYKLLQQIGEGGFGVVYMADQQQPVRRIVALKIIKPGMDTKEVIARFESERQALALMDHPNVARVLDAGATNTGRPYFVMELVKGVPITEFCDQNHLPAAGRLELFRAVCLAVQHAHQKGIIHRDIKPTNILVTLHDGQPVPKVIDFGVAKATALKLTERTLFTAYGQIVGTPAYMSPEQAEMSGLDIDTRSDIYSLGVLLYELLTGTTPLESKRLRQAGYAEMQRIIREEEPPRPSLRLSSLGGQATVLAGNRGTDVKRLTQLLRGDLDWIVMKALEKDRNRRYETPSAFAADVERYLHNEAILARPPSAMYRLRKFARRNRAAVLMAATVLLLLVVGITGTTLGLVWAMQAEADARRDADRARDAEQLAEERLADVKHERDAANNARRDAVAAAEQLKVAVAREESHRIAAHSTAVLPSYPGTALVLAIAAADRSPARTVLHNNVLLAALRACREERTLFAPPYTTRNGRFGRPALVALQLTPDGTRAVAVGERRDEWPLGPEKIADSAYVYDLQTGQVAATLQVPGLSFAAMAIGPDSRLLAAVTNKTALVRYADGQTVAYTDRAVRLWDLRTGAELRVLTGHTDRVVSLRFDAKGERLLSASWDGTARMWDVATGQLRHVLEDRTLALLCAEFSPDRDGRRILTVSRTGNGYTSVGVTKKAIRELSFREAVDADRIVVDPPVRVGAAIRWIGLRFGDSQGGVTKFSAPRLWDALTGKRLAALGEDNTTGNWTIPANDPTFVSPSYSLAAFTPDGDGVVTSEGSQVRLWHAEDGKLVHSASMKANDRQMELVADKRRLRVVRSFRDGQSNAALLIWQADEQVPPLWRCAAGVVPFSRGALYHTEAGLAFLNASLAAQPQVATLADETVTLADQPDTIPDKGSHARLVLRGHEGQVTAGAFLPRSKRLVTTSLDGTLRIWSLDRIDPVLAIERLGGQRVDRAVFLHGGKHVITAADLDVRLMDASDGSLVRNLINREALATSELHKRLVGRVWDLDISVDGTQLVTVHSDAYPGRPDQKQPSELQPSELYTPVRVWDLRTGKQRFALHGLRGNIGSARFSPDGRRILTFANGYLTYAIVGTDNQVHGSGAGPYADLHADIWDADTGKHLRSLGANNFALWSPDGTHILTNDSATFGIAMPTKTPPKGDAARLKAPQLPPRRDSAADINEAATGKRLLSLTGTTAIDTAAYSPDGTLVLGYRKYFPQRQQELIEVWDAATGVQRFVLRGHTGDVTSAVFSPDSQLILTASADGTARLWDATTGAAKHLLHGHRNTVRTACFSPDGKWVATASTDGTARIWCTATGLEWMTLPVALGEVTSVEFSADSGRLLTTSSDGPARIWPVDPLPLALARKPRELTDEERARFQVKAP